MRIQSDVLAGLLIVVMLLLSSCANTPDAVIGVGHPSIPVRSVAGVKKHNIYIATTRALDANPALLYSGERSDDLGLQRVTVFIPPSHITGRLERPKRLPPDPRKDFVVLDPVPYNAKTFVHGLQAELDTRATGDRNVMLFVHGYNTTLVVSGEK